jgi:hypothetical protein
MLLTKLPLLLIVVVSLVGWEVNGQAARSPFSSYGHGDYYGDALVNNQGMAGLGLSNPQYWYLNNQNPALLVYNRFTVFQAGVIGESLSTSSDTLKNKSQNGNLNYLVLGFPLKKNKTTGEVRWSTGIGLMPYSNVSYSYQYKASVNGKEVLYSDLGEGGFNQFYWSNGVKIAKGLNVGLKTSMMFSSIISDYSNVLNDTTQSVKFVPNVHEVRTVKGLKFMPAISYRLDSIKTKYSLNFGLTYEPKSSLSSEVQQILERKDGSGLILQSDTIIDRSSKVTFPSRIAAGVSFGRSDKWLVGADFLFTSFGSSTATLGNQTLAVQNGWKWTIGGELTPDVRSLSSYLKRITYRAGVSSEESSYLVNGHPVKDFGINFGFSFPVNRISSLDIAFRSGKRGNEKLNGIEENYFKIYFGVTFNDTQWFIKRRFD